MILLDYELSPTWTHRALAIDLRLADEAALRFGCFLGDVTFIADGADFSARWDWVPIFDFALSLRLIAFGLDERAHDAFEFTESDARLTFCRQAEVVEIKANYVPARATVLLVDFMARAESFFVRLTQELLRRYPELSRNDVMSELMRVPG